jgi:tetratricopeptide (TPR) repeat protein
MGLLLVCLMLAYSRGALLGLLGGLALWFAVVPLRLRGALALLASGGAAALVTAWAFGQDGLTKDRLPVHIRDDAGHELGVLLALMVVVLLGAALAAGFLSAYRPPSPRARLLASRALLGVMALGVVLFVGGLAASEGGISGKASKAWHQLTDPEARTPANTPDRLTATSSVRARYWREAFDVHADSPWSGAGAAAYATARKRYRTSDIDVQHAHGYAVQTLADLGWIGLLVSIAAFAAWAFGALGATGLRHNDRRLPWDAERVGMAALLAVVVVFGLHSLIDWTWYVPANAVAALLAAGWLVGRGPLRRRLGEPLQAPHDHLPLSARLRAWRPDPYRTAMAAGVLIVAVAAAWTIAQPLRAVHAGDAAIARFQAGAYAAAADIARIGQQRNPLSVEPLFELAAIESAAGRPDRAERALEDAVALQPANAEAWRRLGRFRLSALDQPQQAQPAFRAAYYLDPHSPDSTSDLLEVNRRLAGTP